VQGCFESGRRWNRVCSGGSPCTSRRGLRRCHQVVPWVVRVRLTTASTRRGTSLDKVDTFTQRSEVSHAEARHAPARPAAYLLCEPGCHLRVNGSFDSVANPLTGSCVVGEIVRMPYPCRGRSLALRVRRGQFVRRLAETHVILGFGSPGRRPRRR
jgi:hypothetical protein